MLTLRRKSRQKTEAHDLGTVVLDGMWWSCIAGIGMTLAMLCWS